MRFQAIFLLLGACLDGSLLAGDKPSARNVLFIVCDDLNTHVSPSGYSPISTPTLDRLAADSMTFRRAYCQYPVCGPSRASFLTGLYPESTGVLDNETDIRKKRPGTATMPQFFKEHGYWTASAGKVFHSPAFEHGEIAWNEFLRFENDELPVVTEARKAFEMEHGSAEDPKNRASWKERERRVLDPLNAQRPAGHGRSGLADAQHQDGKNALQVALWLQTRANGDKPFFIACGFHKPHVPFLAPGSYFDLYPLDAIRYEPDRPNLWQSLPKSALVKSYREFGFELGKENDARRREFTQAYHACVSFVDAQLAVVLEALKASGHWEDTVIVFTSDHGFHLGDHFLWGKVSLFDIGTRVPLLVRVPGLTKGGATSEAMVELVDVFPSLADVCGLEVPAHLHGTSLKPVLEKPDTRGSKRYAYTVVSRGQELGRAVRDQEWRYAEWPGGEELYDLTRDPMEKHNLAGREPMQERLQAFRKVMAAKRKEAESRR